jgi:hypothetical protein
MKGREIKLNMQIVEEGRKIKYEITTGLFFQWEHFSQVDTASLLDRTIVSPFLIIKIERGEGVPHRELLLAW